MPDLPFPTYVVAGSIAGAVVMVWVVLRLSGWRKIHRQYGPVIGGFPPGRHMFSGHVGWIQYNNILTVATDPSGLYLKVFFLFRPGHPPLFIPWNEFHGIEHRRVLLSEEVKALIGHPKITSIRLPLKAVRGTVLDPDATGGHGLKSVG